MTLTTSGSHPPGPAPLGADPGRPRSGGPRDQGRAARAHRRIGTHGRGGLRRPGSSRARAGRTDRGRTRRRRDRVAGHRLRRHRSRHGHRRTGGQAAPTGMPGRSWPLPARTGLGWDRDIVEYVDSQPLLRRPTPARPTTSSAASGPSPRSTRSTGRRPRCRPGRASGWPRSSPSSTVSGRAVRRRAVVRSRPGLALPRPHPAPPGGRELGRPGYPPRPGHVGSVDDAGLPAGVPAPLRRHRRGLRPVGRRPPHRRAAVPGNHDVLGVPHLPGLDGPVGHGPRPGCPAHGADPRGHGLPDAAAAARRRRRRRHVRGDGRTRPSPRTRSGIPCSCAPSPEYPTSAPETRSGGTAT